MMQHPRLHVIVIGAGVAGMAAARYLTRAGLRVTVLEKNPHAGGRMYTAISNGFAIDTGAGFLVNSYSHTLALIRELGLEAEVIDIRSGYALLIDGQLHRIWPLLPPVSLHSKLTFCKIFYPLLRHWRALNVHALYAAHRLDTSSIAEYALRKLNRELLEYFIQPLLSGFLYWTPEETSLAMLFLLLKSGLHMRRFTLRHGLGQLAESMASDLNVIKNIEVRSVSSILPSGYTVLAHTAGRERRIDADGIVCAVPASEVTALLPELNPRQRAFFESISYSATAIVSIGLAHRTSTNFDCVFIPRHETNLPYLTTVTSLAAKNPAQVPGDCDLIRLFSSGPASHALMNEDDRSIRDRLVANLLKAGLVYDPARDELFYRVDRWYKAIPKFEVGHFRKLKTFANGEIESGYMVFAGDYLGGPFVEGAITSGLEAGHRLLTRLVANLGVEVSAPRPANRIF
jgi:protoporphyrinogen/coproporphyrinogen III oxidase